MVFSSILFVFYFLVVVLAGYFACPTLRWKNLWLLAASLAFYAWGEPKLCYVMLVSIAFNYAAGLALGRYRGTLPGRWILGLAIGGNLAALASFKYVGFLAESFAPLWRLWGWQGTAPQVVMPIGISFFTFQAVSYLIDVWRGDVEAERSPVNVALYIAFFPQLIAGPIVRFSTIAQELHERQFALADFAAGVERFVCGLGKKVLIANQLAGPADALFSLPPSEHAFASAWLAVVLYTLQIYFDFSGYSDMAIGLGRMFGFKFPENFLYPYTATSVTDFWRRWHISLSTWFRDYLYIPLGGNRHGPWRTYGNLLAVFLLCGLWHGASWTFVLWGLFHGVFLAVERAGASALLLRLGRPFQHAYTLLAVMFAWVLFRVDTLGAAGQFYGAMLGANGFVGREGCGAYYEPTLLGPVTLGILCAMPIFPVWRAWEQALAARGRGFAAQAAAQASASLHVTAVVSIFWMSAALLFAQTYNPFIYFRF